jgi:hypothetical protein
VAFRGSIRGASKGLARAAIEGSILESTCPPDCWRTRGTRQWLRRFWTRMGASARPCAVTESDWLPQRRRS